METFCQVNDVPQSSRSIPKSILQLGKQRHGTRAKAELGMESRALSPDLCTSKICTIHLPSKCPWPNVSRKLMKYIPKPLTPVENNQNFMTYYLKGDYTTQWDGSMRRHRPTLLIITHRRDKVQQSQTAAREILFR